MTTKSLDAQIADRFNELGIPDPTCLPIQVLNAFNAFLSGKASMVVIDLPSGEIRIVVTGKK